MISWSSSFASSTPATSLNVTFFCELDDSFALLLPNDSALLPPLCIWRMKKIQKPIISSIGRPGVEQRRPRAGRRLLRLDDDAAVDQLVGQPFVLARARRCGSCRWSLVMPVISWPVIVDAARSCPASTDAMNSLKLNGASRSAGTWSRSSRSGRRRRRAPSRTPDSSTSSSRRASQTALSLKISTACAGSVTRNASSIPWPATQTIRSVSSTTSGTRSRRPARPCGPRRSPAASSARRARAGRNRSPGPAVSDRQAAPGSGRAGHGTATAGIARRRHSAAEPAPLRPTRRTRPPAARPLLE